VIFAHGKAKKFHETEERKENANRVKLTQHSAKIMIIGKPEQASEKGAFTKYVRFWGGVSDLLRTSVEI
jgi:hypothetical protein